MTIKVGDKIPAATFKYVSEKYFQGTEFKRTSESEDIYRKEWAAIMDHLHSCLFGEFLFSYH